MTKDEILKKLQDENPSSIPVFKAMDEYAKYQAIAFNNWLPESGYVRSGDNEWREILSPANIKSTEQLYNQFIEQQNKQK